MNYSFDTLNTDNGGSDKDTNFIYNYQDKMVVEVDVAVDFSKASTPCYETMDLGVALFGYIVESDGQKPYIREPYSNTKITDISVSGRHVWKFELNRLTGYYKITKDGTKVYEKTINPDNIQWGQYDLYRDAYQGVSTINGVEVSLFNVRDYDKRVPDADVPPTNAEIDVDNNKLILHGRHLSFNNLERVSAYTSNTPLQDAINATSSGDCIYIDEDLEVNGDITLNNKVDIIANDEDDVKINGKIKINQTESFKNVNIANLTLEPNTNTNRIKLKEYFKLDNSVDDTTNYNLRLKNCKDYREGVHLREADIPFGKNATIFNCILK